MKVVDITLYVQYWKQIALNFGHWFLLFFFYFIIEPKCEGNEGNQTNFNNPSGCFELSRFLF